MPVIKSAKKKLKQDKKRQQKNQSLKNLYKDIIKQAIKAPSSELVKKAVSNTDKAVKHNIIHKNKAAHIKAKLYKLVAVKPQKVAKKPTISKKKSS